MDRVPAGYLPVPDAPLLDQAPNIDKVYEWAMRSKVFVVLGAALTVQAGILFAVTSIPIVLAILTAAAAVGCFAYGIEYRDVTPAAQKPADAFISLMHRYGDWIRGLADGDIPEEFIVEKIADVAAIYGADVDEEVLFDKENESALKIEIAKYRELMRFRTSPAEFFREKCQKVCGKDAAELIETLMPEVSLSIEGCAANASMKDLDALCQSLGQMRELINIQELKDLAARLKAQVGDKLAEQILADWDYIGKDIQNNSAMLSEARKQAILDRAVQASQNGGEVDAILDQLKADLDQQMPPVEKIVFKKYGTLSGLLEAMPCSKKQALQQMLAQAYLKTELQNNGRFIGTQVETTVLRELKYDMSTYDQKEKTQQVLKLVMREMLDQPNLQSVDVLKRNLNETATLERMRSAGVKEGDIPRVRALIREYAQMKREWVAKAQVHEKAFEDRLTIALPKGKETIIGMNCAKNRGMIVEALNTSLRLHGDLNHVELDEARFAVSDEKTQKAEAWFVKYQDNFVSEFIQGEDDANECLGDGVCYALCLRMAIRTLMFPDEIAELRSILPSDRILQAAYAVSFSQKACIQMPPELLAQKRLKEKLLFVANRDNICAAITDQMGRLNESNGGMTLGCGGHATLIRFDHKRKLFSFGEPNFGTLKFNQQPGQEPEDLAFNMATCYAELYDWCYSDFGAMFARQLVKMAPGEAIPPPFDIEAAKKYL